MSENVLQGKHILVTGASGGIGRACAVLFSALGARVSLLGRNPERTRQVFQELRGEGHACCLFDLSNIEGIEAQIKEIIAGQGKLDGLMYCAGDCYRYPLSVCKPAAVQKSMQINYFAFVETLRCASKARNSNDRASFVAMSSASSLKGDKALLTLSASKAALNSAVRCAARELAPRRIRVNGIAASYISDSIMVDETIRIFGQDHVAQLLREQQPLGIGSPVDIANTAAFLLSDASRFITGSILLVDGGYMA